MPGPDAPRAVMPCSPPAAVPARSTGHALRPLPRTVRCHQFAQHALQPHDLVAQGVGLGPPLRHLAKMLHRFGSALQGRFQTLRRTPGSTWRSPPAPTP